MQISRDLAGQHLDVAGTEHPRRSAKIADRFQAHKTAQFIRRPFRRDEIVVVEGSEVESLRRHKHARCEIAASAGRGERRVVAAKATVGIPRRDAVEIARKPERARGVRQGGADAFAEGTPPSLLSRPLGPEKQFAAAQQLLPGNLELLTIFQPLIRGDLDADSLSILWEGGSPRL